MALIHMDGLDCYADLTDMSRAGYQPESTTSLAIDTTGGRYGGGSVRFGTASLAVNLPIPLLAYGGTLIVGFAVYHSGSAAGALLTAVSDADATAFKIEHTAAGVLKFYTGASTLVYTSAGAPLTANAWHWVEMKIVLGNSPSGSFEVKVDGGASDSFSSTDTQPTGTGIVLLQLSAGGAVSPNYARIDDIVVMDGTGAALNTFIGDSKITTHAPSSDGGTVDWTASAGTDVSCVDETPSAANGDTDYISSSTAAQESRFNVADLANTPDIIHAVQARYKAKKADAGARTVRGLVNSGGTEQTGTTVGLTTTYAWLKGPVASVDPNTSSAWDSAGVNAVQVGVEVVT